MPSCAGWTCVKVHCCFSPSIRSARQEWLQIGYICAAKIGTAAEYQRKKKPPQVFAGARDPSERRARESNPQPLAGHLISSQAANHSHTLRVSGPARAGLENRTLTLMSALGPYKVRFQSRRMASSSRRHVFAASPSLWRQAVEAEGSPWVSDCPLNPPQADLTDRYACTHHNAVQPLRVAPRARRKGSSNGHPVRAYYEDSGARRSFVGRRGKPPAMPPWPPIADGVRPWRFLLHGWHVRRSR
jgi:hypothetical protein